MPHRARAAWLLAAAQAASAFYLPGVAPREYGPGERVELKVGRRPRRTSSPPLFGAPPPPRRCAHATSAILRSQVNKLTSTKTQLPYEYYSLPFCQPDNVENVAENLGEVLRGDRIMNSHYELKMRVEETCKILCRKDLSAAEMKEFSVRIEQDYRVHWVMDNLPSATKYVDETVPSKPVTIYDLGFPLGFKGSADIPGTKEGVGYLNNHLLITIKYHTDESFEGARIVGFEIEPSSIKHSYSGAWKNGDTQLATCGGSAPSTPLALDKPGEVVFTYDVKWEYSEVKWASRWDTYLLIGDEQIHWFSIVNSLMIVLFLSGMVAMIMTRTLHRDLRRYNDVESMEEMQEESGWKLVSHAPPPPPAIHVPCTAVARSSTCGARCRGARARGRSLPAPRMRRSTATSSARRRALGYSRCTSGRGRRSSRAR